MVHVMVLIAAQIASAVVRVVFVIWEIRKIEILAVRIGDSFINKEKPSKNLKERVGWVKECLILIY